MGRQQGMGQDPAGSLLRVGRAGSGSWDSGSMWVFSSFFFSPGETGRSYQQSMKMRVSGGWWGRRERGRSGSLLEVRLNGPAPQRGRPEGSDTQFKVETNGTCLCFTGSRAGTAAVVLGLWFFWSISGKAREGQGGDCNDEGAPWNCPWKGGK